VTHSDPFVSNAVMLAGRATLIDWDDAGVGIAAIDLGHLLASVAADAADGVVDERLVGAIVAGYRRQRLLTAGERQVLPLATGFTSAIYGAWHLAGAAEGGADDGWKRWWRRHQARERIAAAALQAFR
jgi:Ser/Thr protein kinase RdoA (MazF antagonist)